MTLRCTASRPLPPPDIVVDQEGKVKAESTFVVSPEDHDIEMRDGARQDAKEIQVQVRIGAN